MNEILRVSPRPPIGSLILVSLMYLPWLLYFFRPRATPGEESGMEFPGVLIIPLFGLGYLVAAIALPIRLYRRREHSRAHRFAFYASLGILALFTSLIWMAS